MENLSSSMISRLPRVEYVIYLYSRPYFKVSIPESIRFVIEEIDATFGSDALKSVDVVKVTSELFEDYA